MNTEGLLRSSALPATRGACVSRKAVIALHANLNSGSVQLGNAEPLVFSRPGSVVHAFAVHFLSPFCFGLGGSGNCLMAFSKSPSAASACWMRWRLNLSYSASASSLAISWEILPA